MDDLEAVKSIVEMLKKFEKADQERVIRWSLEKLGISSISGGAQRSYSGPHDADASSVVSEVRLSKGLDIKSFVGQKNPTSDNQFAATVAYYFAFEAAEDQKKDAIDANDLQEACRKSGRARLGDPGKTLRNAHGMGYLDKAERGSFKINTVGENLVAMALPSGGDSSRQTRHVPRKKVAKTAKAKAKKK